MISVSGKKWIEQNINKNLVEKIKQDFNFNEIVSRLIILRDYNICESILINWGNNDIDLLSNQELEGRDLVLTIKAYRAFHPPISIFNSLKSDGSIGLIKNSNIKTKINNVYEVSFSHIQEGVYNERNLYQNLSEYMILNYPYLLADDKNSKYSIALKQFLNDEVALAYIIEKNSMRNFLSGLISRYITRVDELTFLIQSEIQ